MPTTASLVPSSGAYTVIDPSSPIFLRDDTVFIPTVLSAFTGEALDEKLPLLRAMQAVDREGKRLLAHLGVECEKVFPNIGLEQVPLPITHYPLRTIHYPPTTHCALSITCCALSTSPAHYPLPAAHYPPPAAQYPRPVADYPLQEFFLVPREAYFKRPDLQLTGRTIIGKSSARGQERARLQRLRLAVE